MSIRYHWPERGHQVGGKAPQLEGSQKIKMGHQKIVGVLRDSVVLCRAFEVDLQRTSREHGC
jgi:hypothetical protein